MNSKTLSKAKMRLVLQGKEHILMNEIKLSESIKTLKFDKNVLYINPSFFDKLTNEEQEEILINMDWEPPLAGLETPSFLKITAKPDTTPIPQNPYELFRIVEEAAERVNINTFAMVCEYLKRAPEEYMVFFIKKALEDKPELAQSEHFKQWAIDIVTYIF